MRIRREALLNILGVSSAGLTTKEVLEQSSCFVFDGDRLVTFNGEILTVVKNPLKGVDAAVNAGDLLKLLARFPDEVVSLRRDGGEVVVEGKRRRAGISSEESILLPYKDVPAPEDWMELPEVLMGVLHQASRVCGKDETQPRTTEVHVTPRMVEACDNMRLFRYGMKTRLRKPHLIPAASIGALGNLSFVQFSETGDWIHLRTAARHRVSVRCSQGDYPDLSEVMNLGKKPHNVSLPSNLGDMLSRAEVMQTNSYDARVDVHIVPGKLTIRAAKDSGWYEESKRIRHEGPSLSFRVHPQFLAEIIEKTYDVQVGAKRMRIESGNATFLVALSEPE